MDPLLSVRAQEIDHPGRFSRAFAVQLQMQVTSPLELSDEASGYNS
jgi:hypothetical protein